MDRRCHHILIPITDTGMAHHHHLNPTTDTDTHPRFFFNLHLRFSLVSLAAIRIVSHTIQVTQHLTPRLMMEEILITVMPPALIPLIMSILGIVALHLVIAANLRHCSSNISMTNIPAA
mmetsp:Transcript_18798/g.39364  ORF Transcript_18798/g.39364 Transcript_18798/m.39364 type:complete len:119 (-) Transcript_18798:246-602(-)